MSPQQQRSTAIIYLRVSTVGQVNTAHDPEGYSIPGQRDACRRHAKALGADVTPSTSSLAEAAPPRRVRLYSKCWPICPSLSRTT